MRQRKQPMSDKEFHDLYGIVPQDVMDALEENRARVEYKMGLWGYPWAADEIMCDVAGELLVKGGLRRWRDYTDRKPLAAFVNSLLSDRMGEWMSTERPKYRNGITNAPHLQSHKGKRRIPTPDIPNGAVLAADQARARLRGEERAIAESRLCEEGDVFGGVEDGIITAPAGDRSSYLEWLADDEQEPVERRSDAYLPDMLALRDEVKTRYGVEAWAALNRRCGGAREQDGRLMREIRHWLEKSHTGLRPDIADYPYIVRVIRGGRR